MRNSRFSFAYDRTVIATVSTSVAAQAALVVSGVIAARALGPHDRGQLALLISIAVAGSFVAGLGIPTAVAFAAARDHGSAGAALHALRWWVAGQAAVLVAVPALAAWVTAGDAGDRAVALACVPLGAVSLLLVMYGAAVLQGLGRFTAFNVLRLAPIAAYAAGAVVVVAAGWATIAAFLVAWAIGNCATAAATALVVARALSHPHDGRVDARELVRYGLKAQIGTASPLESYQVDQLLVGAVAGPLALGYYVIGSAFTNLPRFIAQSLGMVAFPRVAERFGRGGARAVAVQALFATVLLAGGTVVLLELTMGWLVPFFFGAKFAPSVAIARIMLIGTFCFSMRRVLGDALRGVNKPLPATVAEVLGWAAYGALIVPLATHWGARGGALAIVLSAAISLVFIAWSARRFVGEAEPAPEGTPVDARKFRLAAKSG